MSELFMLYKQAVVIKEQMNLLSEKLSAENKGIMEAVVVGFGTIARGILDLDSAIQKEREDHRKEVERLKNKIAKLESQKQ